MTEPDDPTPEEEMAAAESITENDVGAMINGVFDHGMMLPLARGMKDFYDSCRLVGFADQVAMFMTVEFMKTVWVSSIAQGPKT